VKGGQRWIAWVVLAAWFVWTHALQAWLARGGSLWVPDLAFVLLFSVLARLEPKDAPGLVIVALFARAALSVEPGAALAAGIVAVALLAFWARNLFELTAPAWRALFCGALVLGFDAWLLGVHVLRGGLAGTELPVVLALARLLPVALATALASLVLGPALAHLPGLTPLRSRKW
jgi:hypothetical protein